MVVAASDYAICMAIKSKITVQSDEENVNFICGQDVTTSFVDCPWQVCLVKPI
jgi:hypothetical protein